jgi:hypothetical protein
LWRARQAAAKALGVVLVPFEVRGPSDIGPAMAEILKVQPQALHLYADPLRVAHRKFILDFAARNRIPVVSDVSVLYRSWRVVVVRGASFRPLSQRSPLRGQDTEGRASGQSAGRAAHSVRTRDQSADSPRAGTYHLPAPPDMLDGVLRAVKAFIASAPQSDDIAALACRWKP